MTVIEELTATVRARQHTIEVLIIKLEETNAPYISESDTVPEYAASRLPAQQNVRSRPKKMIINHWGKIK